MTYQAFRKTVTDDRAQPPSQPKSFAAPTGGWVSAKALAGGKLPFKLYGPPAEVLECWFPTETGCELMGGSLKHATIGAFPVESAFSYVGGATRKMFAAGDDSIFNITAPADPEVPPAADVTGLTSAYFSTVNYSTVGGNYLYAVNGTDSARLYDGTSWATITGVGAINITGVVTSTLSHVNVYRNRLIFVQGGTLNVWYLPVDQLGGAAGQISLAGVFQKGGAVEFTSNWSLDSGAGLDDKLAIVSTEGEIAVYQGSDPSDADNWSLVGVYDMPPPLGKNGYMRAGGDLVILTDRGFVPISAAVTTDEGAIGVKAVSRNITPDWVNDARARRALPWEVVKWSNRQRAIVTNPRADDDVTNPPWVYVVNLVTGAWCKRTGWDARCLVLHDEDVYFGTNAGTIMQAEVTGSDDGAIYYANMVLGWDHFGSVGFEKTVLSMRAQFLLSAPVVPRLSASVDYNVSLAAAPNAAPDGVSPGVWDVGLWDVAKWDAALVTYAATSHWESVNMSGHVIAPQLQLTVGNVATPSVQLVIIDTLYETAEIMN